MENEKIIGGYQGKSRKDENGNPPNPPTRQPKDYDDDSSRKSIQIDESCTVCLTEEVICINCHHRWVEHLDIERCNAEGIREFITPSLKDIVCPNCSKHGYVIITGQRDINTCHNKWR